MNVHQSAAPALLSHAASSTESSFARIPPILLKAGIWMPYFSSSLFMLLISSSAAGDNTEGTDQRREAEQRAGLQGATAVHGSWLVLDNPIMVWLQDSEPS